jgi:hypothetical protein
MPRKVYTVEKNLEPVDSDERGPVWTRGVTRIQRRGDGGWLRTGVSPERPASLRATSRYERNPGGRADSRVQGWGSRRTVSSCSRAGVRDYGGATVTRKAFEISSRITLARWPGGQGE